MDKPHSEGQAQPGLLRVLGPWMGTALVVGTVIGSGVFKKPYAVTTDVREFGMEDCWELDALPPDVLVNLIRTNVERLIDADAWNAALRREARNRKLLDRVADNWTKVEKLLKGMKRNA